MIHYFATENSWWDPGEVKLYWEWPKGWGYIGGIRTSENELEENFPVGEKYWSIWYCNMNQFYASGT